MPSKIDPPCIGICTFNKKGVCIGYNRTIKEIHEAYLKSIGMKYIMTEKLCLAQMPGGNRIGEDGKPMTKNFCKIDGMWLKYEPVFVWRKI